MVFCEYCGKQLNEGAKFCRECGAPAEGRPIQAGKETEEKLTQPPKAVVWAKEKLSWIKEKELAFWKWKWSKAVLGAVLLIAVVLVVIVAALRGDGVDEKSTVVEDEMPMTFMEQITQEATEEMEAYIKEQKEMQEQKPKESEYVFVPDYRPGHENTTGNTASNWYSNARGTGSIAEQDGWVYYDFGAGLYKMSNSSNGSIEIYSEPVDNINVLGDWIYCRKFNEILKIRTDGKEVYTLASNCHGGVDIIVIDHYLFYISEYQISATDKYDTLHRIDLNTLENKVILDEKNTGFGFGFEYYDDEAVYCWSNLDSEEDYFWVDFDGNIITWNSGINFYSDAAFGDSGWVNVYKWKTEKVNYEEHKFFTIVKANIDGTRYDVRDIGPVDETPMIWTFEDYVVFSVEGDPDDGYYNGLYLVNCKTGEVSKINSDKAYVLHYAAGYLYYGDSHYIEYYCRIDGSDWGAIG